ncbi:MAG TPA: NADH-quinone oxidoreductase subunit J [Candidatus Gastranaerophilales bacterium]|nr:NADH-quinone oxidoreductase subunit J [Candidatus Gastranaerophilales bacterium]
METQDIIYSSFFYIIAFILIIAALGVVFIPRIVYSAVSMIVAFLSIAGIFVLLNADFVAISQIIIYAVGITIVLIFAIMLTATKEDQKLWIAIKFRSLIAFASVGLLFLLIITAVTNNLSALSQDSGIFAVKQPSSAFIEKLKTEGTTSVIGEALLTDYILPFEILSLLLLAAITGAVVIAGKSKEKLINPTTQIGEENFE